VIQGGHDRQRSDLVHRGEQRPGAAARGVSPRNRIAFARPTTPREFRDVRLRAVRGRRSQERGAGGRTAVRRPGSRRGDAPQVAALPRPLGVGRPPDPRVCRAIRYQADAAARSDLALDRRRHGLPQAGQALAGCEAAVHGKRGQGRQLPSRGQLDAVERADAAADRLLVVLARRLGSGSPALRGSEDPGVGRVQAEVATRARHDRCRDRARVAARGGSGGCRLRHEERVPRRPRRTRAAVRGGGTADDARLSCSQRRQSTSRRRAGVGRRTGALAVGEGLPEDDVARRHRLADGREVRHPCESSRCRATTNRGRSSGS